MNTITQFVIPGIVFLLTLVFGVWLSNAGKPYNGLLFNIHKLVALGVAILTAVQLFKVLQSASAQVAPILLVILAVMCAVALFATGALMSLDKMSYRVTLTIHQLAPLVAAIAMAVAVYLLAGTKP